MLALLLQAIAIASQPVAGEVLSKSHLSRIKKQHPPARPTVDRPKKKVRRWKGVYEHKDTPIHHH
jgi:hypothetical protein